MADATTTDDKPKVDEQQAKTANEMEQAKWEDDFKKEDLEIPYKREEDKEETSKDDDTTGDKADPGDAGTGDGKTEDAGEATYTEPSPVITIEDPGEYQPADYSFEIEIKGKTHKVDSAEKAAELAEEFAEDLSAKQLVNLVSKGSSIELKQERDKDRWQEKKDKFDSQNAEAQKREETINDWTAEFDYLTSKGLLPAIAKEYKDADWADPEVAKQPGVKEQVAIVNYMAKENELRQKAKVKPLTSIVDAFNAWKLENGKQEEQDEERKAGEARKAAGARVAGVSPSNQQGYVPKGISVGRVIPFRGTSQWED